MVVTHLLDPDAVIVLALDDTAHRRRGKKVHGASWIHDGSTEFLGHFERRKVSTGTCARAFDTACIHEHACIRCSMHWPDPAQRNRLTDIRDNLTARIAEAEREGWLGEVEGLKISLAGAEDKLAQIERRANQNTV
jgi:hypothetical protein